VVVDRRGARPETVVEDSYQAAWEPGGEQLAYIDNRDRKTVWVLTPADGEWQRQAIRHQVLVEGIAWRPPMLSPAVASSASVFQSRSARPSLHTRSYTATDYPVNPMEAGGVAVNDIRAKVAYLHGLAEGLDLDVSSNEGRLLSSMLDVMSEMAEQLIDVTDAQTELAEYVEDVDFDLGALEESVYETEDEDEGEEVLFIPEEAVVEEEDGVELVCCPSCGETLAAGIGDLDDAELDVTCPVCGATMQIDEFEFDEDLTMEHD
jgi:hypothetical protein